MAKKSKIARNEQRRDIVARYAERRAELKELIRNPATADDRRAAAQLALQRLPRDASPVRLRNRDATDGRPAVISASSDYPGCVCASWPTGGSCPVYTNRVGRPSQISSEGPGMNGRGPEEAARVTT
ncbi:30S ribosomal protein S14 [Nocardia africana]|uniref:30S ribosomal protein S14 n=1 Tax=Nocardia africana TaxID=134964 RepID=A0A378X362_9NOCA|nr:30S ribosomal protein S14 [Nocardia africana]